MKLNIQGSRGSSFIIRILSIILVLMILKGSELLGNVISSRGEISFDINNDGQSEAIVNQNGLAVGTGLSPSSRLHVQGNALISGSFNTGSGTIGNSTLGISGTFGQSFETLSSNADIGSHSMVFGNSSAGNITLTLPDSTTIGDGRCYTIKKTSSDFTVVVRSDGGKFDGENAIGLSVRGHLKVISNSGNWSILSVSDNLYASAWTPEDITTALWFDANDASTIFAGGGGNVGRWEDKSGNDYHVTQSLSTRQPTTGVETLNGLNVIDWPDAVNDDYLAKDGDNNQNWQDVYVVGRYDGGSTFADYYGFFTGYRQFGTGDAIGFVGDTQAPDTEWYVNSKWWDNAYFNGSVLGAPYAVLGGSPTLEDPYLVSISANTPIAVDGVCIGNDRRNVAANRGWRGYLAEVIAFNSKLSDADRQKVEGYLAHKWGLEGNLPASHPYKNSAP